MSRNFIAVFSCRPGGEPIVYEPSVAVEFIDKLESTAETDGSILFPTMEIFVWTPGNNDGEFACAFNHSLLFNPKNDQLHQTPLPLPDT